MLIKTKAIVISTTKYQDKSLIVKCLTKSEGIKTYFVYSFCVQFRDLRGWDNGWLLSKLPILYLKVIVFKVGRQRSVPLPIT